MSRAVNIKEKTTVFKGYLQIDRYRLSHRLYDGGFSPELVREVLERGHVGAVLPYDPVLDSVILIEQFRPGALAAGFEPWLIECVAGIIEDGETAEEMIARESIEECGCVVADLIPMHHFITSPGACSETVALYCGRVDAGQAGEIHGLAEEGEDIKVSVFSITQAGELLKNGKIVNAKTIIALQWLLLNHEMIKARWN